jgi:uncharacterized protein YbjT (DUF2867 family)
MENILITGATGNVGTAILAHFIPNKDQKIFIATREKNPVADNALYFDFEDMEGQTPTLQQINTLFLLRPPHISDVQKFFKPLIANAKMGGVQQIIFLSVQGAESVSFIPHAKIEKLLIESGMHYTFIRPSYFMQNLTTTLVKDIREKNRIYLPAGKGKFLWVDVSDIGLAIAKVLQNPENHTNKAYTITGKELMDFHEVAALLSQQLGRQIKFVSPNLFQFFITKKREGMAAPFIFVMIMLHYLPKFQKPPKISGKFTQLTGKQPRTLEKFIKDNLGVWE